MVFSRVFVGLMIGVLLCANIGEAYECQCQDAVCSCVEACPQIYGVPVEGVPCEDRTKVCCIKNSEQPKPDELEDITALFSYFKRQELRAQQVADNNF